jgi:sec-independent protein translocase protein TatA
MAIDTTVILILVVVVIILFGSSKIPQLARALGQARAEFDKGSKGEPPSGQASRSSTGVTSSDDPLVLAAQKEGIDTQGKTREQIASELSWKLNRK